MGTKFSVADLSAQFRASKRRVSFGSFSKLLSHSNRGPLPGMTEDRFIYRSGNLMRMQGDADLPEYFVTDLAKQQTTPSRPADASSLLPPTS